MKLEDVKEIEVDKLELDFENPRISEFGISEKTSQKNILQVLWDEMGVNELIHSIVSNGFWDYEPLIGIERDKDKFTIIEGNRRLAAVMLIRNREQIDCKFAEHIENKINDALIESLNKLPVLEVNNRKETWQFVGFKHVNGPAKWGSYAKAKYTAEIHNEFGISLDEIANLIGDTHNTVQKLYQGLMVLEQAEKAGVYSREDIQANRLYFSHLYTAITYNGFKEFLDLKDPSEEDPNPVPDENVEKLGELLKWLYGSQKENQPSVIISQNPYLRYLDEVLKDKDALSALRDGETLNYAHELSRSDSALFQENLSKAKRSLQKARGYIVTGFDGDRSLLETAEAITRLATSIYDEMYEASFKRKTSQNDTKKEIKEN